MKKYIVTIERNYEIISEFQVNAMNIKEARLYAQINKADSCRGLPLHKCKVNVRLAK